ncbi:MAG: hypothetical protein ACRC6R_07905 [Bacteroidales bacterium]
MVSWNRIDKLYSTVGECFYLFEEDLFRDNLRRIKRELTSDLCSFDYAYSFKSNYLPRACKIARQEGFKAEVVSIMEYEIALTVGYTPEEIIFNGPIKRDNDLIRAINDGALVHLDSHYELEVICSAAENNLLKPGSSVGLRIQVGDCSRFGFTRADIGNVIKRVNDSGLTIVSLHGHLSTADRAAHHYGSITQELLEIANHFSLDSLKSIDVGGGFFGAYPQGVDPSLYPSFDHYAKQITDSLSTSEWFSRIKPNIIVEPGVSVLANSSSFITKIFDVKSVMGKRQLTVDGSVYNIKPSGPERTPLFRAITKVEGCDTTSSSIVGSTCMERDVIVSSSTFEKADIGDFIVFYGMGAYTNVLTPNFINYQPPIYSLDSNGEMECVRRKQTISDLLLTYKV